ncbi:MAG: thioesterase family protein [Gammaproteobacteria bacterium]|nr:thioesterase family protein [Gammaproteobacteria bacterium]MBT8150756.1 thioesterase family protein [Gammaproteobacteria bacterium]NNM11618.1 acyl-CoA thioesterase II [Pseudomonadales bacterium]RZV57579.1 MAG: acyl-CoA thioesterase II [Pseudomonadales bacterium]
MANENSKIEQFMWLEIIEQDIFRGESRNIGTPQVYGGQVLGQALRAARLTVENRDVHSVHAYFLRRGDFDAPIVYQVDRSRDGGSFSARRVVAIQHGKPIFTLSASFQAAEDGLDYFTPHDMPPTPDELTQKGLLNAEAGRHAMHILASDFDVFKVEEQPPNAGAKPEVLRWWIKSRERLPDGALALHREILAYVSDFGLLYAAMMPHAEAGDARRKLLRNTNFASIDHTIWFHRPLRMDDWLLYDSKSISTSNGRASAQGGFYNTRGELLATIFQEGLARQNL